MEKKILYSRLKKSNVDNPIERSKELIKSIAETLQTRIEATLKNKKDRFQKYAYDNREKIVSIVDFDESSNSGGRYVNGKCIIGNDIKYNKTNEDIMATMYHEYNHYLNDLYKVFPYRITNVLKGEVYQKIDTCYEYREENEKEFLENAYWSYQIDLSNSVDTEKRKEFDSLPDFYTELTNIQLSKFKNYIEINKLKPKPTCIIYHYSPSNYYLDEINAHTETLKANEIKTFNMNESKIDFYKSEINKYNKLHEKSKKYEEKNRINEEGYEY